MTCSFPGCEYPHPHEHVTNPETTNTNDMIGVYYVGYTPEDAMTRPAFASWELAEEYATHELFDPAGDPSEPQPVIYSAWAFVKRDSLEVESWMNEDGMWLFPTLTDRRES